MLLNVDTLYLIWKLSVSGFLICQFQIDLMLCHATHCNAVKQGTCKSCSSKEPVGADNNWAVGNYCHRMSSNEWVTRKIMSNLLCILLITQCSLQFFTTLKYRALSVNTAYVTISTKCSRMCMWQIWHNYTASWRYAVGCVLTPAIWGWDR